MPNILLLNRDGGANSEQCVVSDKQMSLFLLDLLFWSALYEVSALEEPCLHTAVSVLTWLHGQVKSLTPVPMWA